MKNFLLSLLNKSLGALIFCLLVLGAGYVYAWTGPGSNPPNGNTEAPINVGTVTQTKNGDLGLLGNLGASGAALLKALVVGSTSAPASFLFIDGNQGSGKVLTSDTNGQASWQSIVGGGSGGGTVAIDYNQCYWAPWVWNSDYNAADSTRPGGGENSVSCDNGYVSTGMAEHESGNRLEMVGFKCCKLVSGPTVSTAGASVCVGAKTGDKKDNTYTPVNLIVNGKNICSGDYGCSIVVSAYRDSDDSKGKGGYPKGAMEAASIYIEDESHHFYADGVNMSGIEGTNGDSVEVKMTPRPDDSTGCWLYDDYGTEQSSDSFSLVDEDKDQYCSVSVCSRN